MSKDKRHGIEIRNRRVSRIKPIAIKDKLPKGYINPLTHPEVFLKRLKEDPWRIITDGEIRVAIRGLQGDCLIGSNEQAERAKKLLRRAGIAVFIPKKSKKRMTENLIFKYLQSNPYLLVELVKIEKGWIEPEIDHIDRINKKHKVKPGAGEVIEKLFRKRFGEEIPDELLDIEINKDGDSIALLFIAYNYGISFLSLKKFYYDSLPRVRHGKKSIIRVNRTDKKVDLIYPF